MSSKYFYCHKEIKVGLTEIMNGFDPTKDYFKILTEDNKKRFKQEPFIFNEIEKYLYLKDNGSSVARNLVYTTFYYSRLGPAVATFLIEPWYISR